MNKETKENRRKRQAEELIAAYNDGGDYEKIIKEIEDCGDTFRGWLTISAEGIVTKDSFLLTYNEAQVAVFRQLPPKPHDGWNAALTMVEVFYDGANVPPKYNGNHSFRKDIWK